MVSNLTEIWEKNVDKKAAKARAVRVLSAIKKYHPKAKTVLELGVGLGVVLFHFKKFDKYGLDLGKEYVKVAKKIVPNAKLFVQSIDRFQINETFDIIFSVHECINEVKPYKKWESTFKHAHKHLNDNGLFIFDMRTEKHLEDMKKQVVKLEETPTGYIYDNTIVRGNKLTWDTTLFKKVKNKLYEIEKDRYDELIYPVAKVKKSLTKNFKVLETIFFENKRKAMFICRKK
ncbi:MAG: class I SAM-dependent methyltransferase [Candidatus Woesearchaeota archaeon]